MAHLAIGNETGSDLYIGISLEKVDLEAVEEGNTPFLYVVKIMTTPQEGMDKLPTETASLYKNALLSPELMAIQSRTGQELTVEMTEGNHPEYGFTVLLKVRKGEAAPASSEPTE